MNDLQSKKDRFQPKKTFPRGRFITAAAMAALAIMVLFLIFSGGKDQANDIGTAMASPIPAAASPGQDFRISVSEVGDGNAKFYKYKASNNKTVRFLP